MEITFGVRGSLPTRERGLKREPLVHGAVHFESLPTRERGLKLVKGITASGPASSLPTRERGLKRSGLKGYYSGIAVAPYAGAWIETNSAIIEVSCGEVAPYAGAWIETNNAYKGKWSFWSLPTRERGLKLSRSVGYNRVAGRSLRGSVD